jgi:hypothetical protein
MVTIVAVFCLWYMVMQSSTVAMVTGCVVCNVLTEAEETDVERARHSRIRLH